MVNLYNDSTSSEQESSSSASVGQGVPSAHVFDSSAVAVLKSVGIGNNPRLITMTKVLRRPECIETFLKKP
jgi:hypothetical protein